MKRTVLCAWLMLFLCGFVVSCTEKSEKDETLRLYAYLYNEEGVPEWTELTSQTEGYMVYDSIITEGGINRTVIVTASGEIEVELLSEAGQLFFGETKHAGEGEVLDFSAQTLMGRLYTTEKHCAVNVCPVEAGTIQIAIRSEGEERILTLVQQDRTGLSEEEYLYSGLLRMES